MRIMKPPRANKTSPLDWTPHRVALNPGSISVTIRFKSLAIEQPIEE